MSAVLERAAREWEAARDRVDPVLAELRQLRADVAELRRARGTSGPNATVDEAAEILGCQRSRVFELLRDGRLRRAKRTGRKTLVTRESVDAYAAAAPEPTSARRAASAGERERAEILKLLRPAKRAS